MDEYDLQFVERNATVYEPNGNNTRRVPSRTIVGQPRAFGNHPQVIYAQGPALGVGIGGGSSLLGRLSTGHVIDMVAQIFAALMPMPGSPVATGDAATDVGNLILYQGSLAQYAKRDEQVRTLGNLIVKLVG